MQVVGKPGFEPYRCAVSLRSEDPDGFINTNVTLNGFDPHIFVSMTAARELARIAGWVDPAVHAEKVAELEGVKAQLDAAVDEIAALRKREDAIETLKGGGFQEVKRAGRPSKRTLPETVREELGAAA